MSKVTAVQLLRAHRDDIAHAIVKGVDRLAPGLSQIDPRARHQTILAIVDAFADAVKTGETKALASLLRNATQLRAAGGVPRQDLLASSHAYMPGVRTVFLQVHPDRDAALAAYDVVEAMALPLIADFCRVVLQFDAQSADSSPKKRWEERRIDDDPTHPGREPPTRAKRGGTPASPFDSLGSTERAE